MNIISILRFSIALLLLSSIAFSEEKQNKVNVSPFTPSEMKKQIETYGEREVLNYVFSNNDRASIFLTKIKRGDSEWLVFFYTFRMISDGLWSTLLDGSIGYALDNNPTEALRIIKRFSKRSNLYGTAYVEEVCRTVDEGWEDWGDGKKNDVERAESAIKEIEKRSKGVKQVKDNSLLNIKKQCLDELEKSKAGWEKYKKEKTEDK